MDALTTALRSSELDSLFESYLRYLTPEQKERLQAVQQVKAMLSDISVEG